MVNYIYTVNYYYIEVINTNEKELSLKIVDFLNEKKSDCNFKFIDSYCDIADEERGIYIEVKNDYEHFAYAQLFQAIIKGKITNANYLGVTDNIKIKLYKMIPYNVILNFVNEYDPKHKFSASQFDKDELNKKAEQLLGIPYEIIEFSLQTEKYFYITKDNMDEVRKKTDRSKIQLDLLVNWLDGIDEEDDIKVNKEGYLINMFNGNIFTNEAKDSNEITKWVNGHPKYKYHIKSEDSKWFESLRIKHENVIDVLHEVDRLIPINKRRALGAFWTEQEISNKLSTEIMDLIKPDYVIEPCVGGGSLIKNIVPKIKGVMNDISLAHVENCKTIFSGYNWTFTNLDVVKTQTDSLLKEWKVPSDKKLLLYTNPPFGVSTGNKLNSKKKELINKSRLKITIEYPKELEKYGKGDLFMPIIGRLIEIAKTHEKSYLVFFSPLGLFCKRTKFLKLFNALIKDFKFIKGYIIAGYNFHDINKTLPIALTMWEYSKNINTEQSDINLIYLDKDKGNRTIEFKEMSLLKDGWNYGGGGKGRGKYKNNKNKKIDEYEIDKKIIHNEIYVSSCDRFNNLMPKIFSSYLQKGSGAELSPDNVKIKLNIPNIPDELIYGLWSVTVGSRVFDTSLSTPLHPIYISQSYVHLPDFNNKKVIEILAYSILNILLRNYAEDRIGFFGNNRVFKFGNERLTKGAEYIIDLCKNCNVYENYTISDIFEKFKNSNIDTKNLRKGLIKQVYTRLDEIGYWNYIPIPSNHQYS